MTGYDDDDEGGYDGYEQGLNIAVPDHGIFSQPPHEGYYDQPYPHRQIDNHLFPLRQGQQRLRCEISSPHSDQTQAMGRFVRSNSFRSSADTNAVGADRSQPPSYGTQPSHQTAGYYYPYPQDISSQMLSLNPVDGYQGGRTSTTNETRNYQPVLFPTLASAQSLSWHTDTRTYASQHGLPTRTGFRSDSDSFASTAAHPATEASNEGQSWMDVMGVSMNVHQSLNDPPPDTTNTLSPNTRYLHLDSAYTAPWSPLQSFDTNEVPQSHDEGQLSWRSRFSGRNVQSSHMTPTSTTPLSSVNLPNNDMEESMMTVRAQPHRLPRAASQAQSPTSYRMVPHNTPFDLFQLNVERSATPHVGGEPTCNGYTQSEAGFYLALPTTRKPSSARSSISSVSSPGAPPTEDPEVLECEQPGCLAFFTGDYRRGNLGRHRRLRHGNKSYVCEDDTCAKEFRRQDARLKHYRKYHRSLAASSPYVPRPSQSRRPRGDPEVDLRYTSGWT
jgi:hypothetical protein